MPKTSIFPFPIEDLQEISNERIKLLPFNPDHHGATFIRHASPNPSIFSNVTMGPWHSTSELQAAFYDSHDRDILSFANPASFALAIIDKTRPPSSDDAEGELAGTISYINTSTVHLSAELGFVVVLPPYQRSHVAVNAVGLMMQHAFASRESGGLGLRRVYWKASTVNLASVRLAEKMGFVKVGVTRYAMRFPRGAGKGKVGNGRALPPGSDPDDVWRDTVDLSIAWDEWLGGAEEMARVLMSK
ncbi:hypothetical protein N7454_010585 [Penicillium verhagenii]|nr:hypothetical protein N7454_010585 [Penicillium verhagenii]